MNRNKRIALLIACACILAIGSYILITAPSDDTSVHRETVAPLADDNPEAPNWVKNGQSPDPDYTPADSEAHNATPTPPSESEAGEPQVIEVTEDRMVTFTFVESLADFLLYRFAPKDSQGKPTSAASAKTLNMYYGNELDGFAVSVQDIRTARKTVLDYAFNPDMLYTLSKLYAPVFVAQLVDTAKTDERLYAVGDSKEQRTLTDPEIAAMLRLNALKMEQTATVFQAIADDPQITTMAGKYLGAAKAVERVNGQLQKAIAEDKDTAQAGERLKQAILQRERIKASVVSRLKESCQTCSDGELFYLAQWSYRRVLNEPDERLATFNVAAEILRDLAETFRDEAATLK